jgi:hypothetical protein
MKKVIVTLIILLTTSQLLPQKDYTNFRTFYGMQLNTGITFFKLDPLKEDFNNIVKEFITKYNIPLQIQHLYPANILWGGNFFWYTSRGWSVVFGAEFTGTEAYSMYEDYAGTLDIRGEISMTYVNAGFKKHFDEVEFIQPLIGLNLGIALYEYKTHLDLNINNGEHHETENFAFSDLGFDFELCAGFNYDMELAVIEFTTGYRYLKPISYEFFEQHNFNFRLGLKKGIFK